MKDKTYGEFIAGSAAGLNNVHIKSCLFELTYRCNLNCIHCYCKGSEDFDNELDFNQVKAVLDDIYKNGCLRVVFTGGEPLLREDFLDIYLYAKKRGFIVDVFTNATLIDDKHIDVFKDYPPSSIEITLNGILKDTYERITQVQGSFRKVLNNIEKLVQSKLPVVIKVNCMQQNKDQIIQIKQYVEGILGKDKRRFKFDIYIYPRLNADTTPCRYRLDPLQLQYIRESDQDILDEYKQKLERDPVLLRDRKFLYQCNSWLKHFFINPKGRLKFCQFSEEFSIDLKRVPFNKGFNNMISLILKQEYKTNSICKDCKLRAVCMNCPAKAYLETGDEESPVSYFCQLAKDYEIHRLSSV